MAMVNKNVGVTWLLTYFTFIVKEIKALHSPMIIVSPTLADLFKTSIWSAVLEIQIRDSVLFHIEDTKPVCHAIFKVAIQSRNTKWIIP